MHSAYRLASWTPYLLTLAFAVAVAGCGAGHPKVYRVSGRVTVASKPLPVGDIILYPEAGPAPQAADGPAQEPAKDAASQSKGTEARGVIGPDGRFQLSTFEENDGAAKGTYKVVVTATEKVGAQVRSLVPDRFSMPHTSDKTVTVDGATDALNIDLTWAPGERPWVRPYREDKQ